MRRFTFSIPFLFVLTTSAIAAAAQQPAAFLSRHCYECHNADTQEGGLDLTSLKVELSNAGNFSRWVKIHDRIKSGEMPPKQQERPPVADQAEATNWLKTLLIKAEHARLAAEPRTGLRRMTRA